MARARSPNYPVISLSKAIDYMRPVFARENRNKMPRLVLAKHLGNNSLNGRVLVRIGALRAYGLIDGSADELRVSDDAINLLAAPEDSAERTDALLRCAYRPAIFNKLAAEIEDPDRPPSIETVIFNLRKEGFTESAAQRAARAFLDTLALVAGKAPAYDEDEEDAAENGDDKPSDTVDQLRKIWRETGGPNGGNRGRQQPVGGLKLMTNERELTTGLLSKGTNFRLIVSGPVGVKEIERLIMKLEIDKDILADGDETENDRLADESFENHDK